MRDLIGEGLSHFNSQRYFEAHEAFEDLWRPAEGDARLLYQGLAQACAGLVKYQRGQPGPARTLLIKGLLKMEKAPRACWPDLDIALLARDLREVLEAIGAGCPFDPPVMKRARGV